MGEISKKMYLDEEILFTEVRDLSF